MCYNLFGKAMQFPTEFSSNLFISLLYAITCFSNYEVLYKLFGVNCLSLVPCLRSLNYIWPELKLELELELILTKILELELELNPKNVAGIGIGINSIFFGMTNGLPTSIPLWSGNGLSLRLWRPLELSWESVATTAGSSWIMPPRPLLWWCTHRRNNMKIFPTAKRTQLLFKPSRRWKRSCCLPWSWLILSSMGRHSFLTLTSVWTLVPLVESSHKNRIVKSAWLPRRSSTATPRKNLHVYEKMIISCDLLFAILQIPPPAPAFHPA